MLGSTVECSAEGTKNLQSCNFYDQCLENRFECSSNGFILSYAKRRCEAILTIEDNSPYKEWMIQHEACLQQKLYQLTINMTQLTKSREAPPDKPVCLQFEKKAFEAVEECYIETHESLCNISGNGTDLRNDLYEIVRILTLNDSYFNHTVQISFARRLEKCGRQVFTEVSEAIIEQQPKRLVLCFADMLGFTEEHINSLLESISKTLNRSRKEFTYGRYIFPQQKGPCYSEAPGYIRIAVHLQKIHFVIWPLSSGQSVPQLKREYQSFNEAIQDRFIFWPANGYKRDGVCGDGIRQANEGCDFGVFYGEDFGCTEDCNVLEEHECYTNPLSPDSLCHKQTCGNGKRTSNEQCDDNNLSNGDGCSSNCTIEEGWECTVEYVARSDCSRNNTLSPSPSSTFQQSSIPVSSSIYSGDESSTPTMPTSTLPTETTTVPNIPLSPSASGRPAVQLTVVLGALLVVFVSWSTLELFEASSQETALTCKYRGKGRRKDLIEYLTLLQHKFKSTYL